MWFLVNHRKDTRPVQGLRVQYLPSFSRMNAGSTFDRVTLATVMSSSARRMGEAIAAEVASGIYPCTLRWPREGFWTALYTQHPPFVRVTRPRDCNYSDSLGS